MNRLNDKCWDRVNSNFFLEKISLWCDHLLILTIFKLVKNLEIVGMISTWNFMMFNSFWQCIFWENVDYLKQLLQNQLQKIFLFTLRLLLVVFKYLLLYLNWKYLFLERFIAKLWSDIIKGIFLSLNWLKGKCLDRVNSNYFLEKISLWCDSLLIFTLLYTG